MICSLVWQAFGTCDSCFSDHIMPAMCARMNTIFKYLYKKVVHKLLYNHRLSTDLLWPDWWRQQDSKVMRCFSWFVISHVDQQHPMTQNFLHNRRCLNCATGCGSGFHFPSTWNLQLHDLSFLFFFFFFYCFPPPPVFLRHRLSSDMLNPTYKSNLRAFKNDSVGTQNKGEFAPLLIVCFFKCTVGGMLLWSSGLGTDVCWKGNCFINTLPEV